MGSCATRADAEPIFIGVCHCKDCQEEAGAAFNITVAVPQAAVPIQGPAKTYSAKADSGKDNVRRLCPNCGSTILSEPTAMPGASIIRAGTLDDPSWLKPSMEICCDRAQPWMQLGGDMKRLPGMPQPSG